MGRSRDPLFDEGRRKHPLIGFFILLLALIVVAVAVLNTISNSRVSLVRQSVTVPNLPGSFENFRILHISDLHGLYFGPHQEQVQAAEAQFTRLEPAEGEEEHGHQQPYGERGEA